MLKTLDEEERLRVVDGDKAEEKVTPDYSLKRRLSECSRRFHNHGEGPY